MADKRKGYVIMWRSAWDNPIFANDRANYFSAWMYLIAHANYKNGTIRTSGKIINVGRGQIHTTIRYLALVFQWDKNTVMRFLNNLEKMGMITQNKSASGTLLTIVNYNKYQDLSHHEYENADTDSYTGADTDADTGADTESPLLNTSNNTLHNSSINTSKKEAPARRGNWGVVEE